MATVMGQSCSALVAQACLCLLMCVQSCHGFVTAVASGCGPAASPMFGKRLGSPPHEQQSRTSHLRADAGPCIAEW
jgi:hypothetical protein